MVRVKDTVEGGGARHTITVSGAERTVPAQPLTLVEVAHFMSSDDITSVRRMVEVTCVVSLHAASTEVSQKEDSQK